MPDSPYFTAVKAAMLVKLVYEQERSNRSVSLDDVRMFRIRAHEVATMAEMAEQPKEAPICPRCELWICGCPKEPA